MNGKSLLAVVLEHGIDSKGTTKYNRRHNLQQRRSEQMSIPFGHRDVVCIEYIVLSFSRTHTIVPYNMSFGNSPQYAIVAAAAASLYLSLPLLLLHSIDLPISLSFASIHFVIIPSEQWH